MERFLLFDMRLKYFKDTKNFYVLVDGIMSKLTHNFARQNNNSCNYPNIFTNRDQILPVKLQQLCNYLIL